MKSIKQFIALRIVTVAITSCNEEKSATIYPHTITSFEATKTEAYPEETITFTADATCDSDENLTTFLHLIRVP